MYKKPLKKIVILYARHTFNYGTCMMVINFIDCFSKLNGEEEIKYFVDYSTKEDMARLDDETLGRYDIQMLEMGKIKFQEKYFGQADDIFKCDPNAVIFLGGDNLSEYYGKIIKELFRIYRISRKFPVFLVSQTIGPFNSWRKKIASFCLRKCHIYSRDAASLSYLKNELGLTKVFDFRDLAFLDLPKQTENDSILEKYNLRENDYLTLVPSGAYRQYTGSFDNYIKSWVEIIADLIKNDLLKNKKIVLLSHVPKPYKKSDNLVIACILAKLDKRTLERVISITEEILPSQARKILGSGIFALSGRMHGAISAFQMGKPAISLSYSVKYSGVIGEGLKMRDLVLESRGDCLWQNNLLVGEVRKKINYLMENYGAICYNIKEEVEASRKIIFQQMEDIANKIF